MENIRFAPPYRLPTFDFTTPPELRGESPGRYPVVIAGAGPAGLALACDLAQRGIASVLLDDDQTVGVRGASSRGICYAQKTLELLERMGVGRQAVDKGVTWSEGRTFSGDEEVYRFNLQDDSVSLQPPFINLQQFYLEGFLVERIQALGRTDLRWLHRVTSVEPCPDHVLIQVETPAGSYSLEASHLVDATGANSAIRTQLGLDAHASHSTDRWCISDVRFTQPLPAERWTWVDAPFNAGRGVWQHLMADDVWRIDYQMPEDADLETISRPEVVAERLRAQLGPDVDFEFVWIGPYQYRDHLLDHFRYGRIFFAGDAAHVVSPFGARGGNTGIQDAINLGWKLALVVQGHAPDALLESYTTERRPACVENLQVTSRTARFLAPRSETEHILRQAVLDLARHYPFARRLVNTGRMSVANDYPPSPWLPTGARSVQNVALTQPDGRPTSIMQLLRDGTQFLALWFTPAVDAVADMSRYLAESPTPVRLLAVGGSAQPALPASVETVVDAQGQLARHLGLSEKTCSGTVCLIRPDAYLAATLPACTPPELLIALRRALQAEPTPGGYNA